MCSLAGGDLSIAKGIGRYSYLTYTATMASRVRVGTIIYFWSNVMIEKGSDDRVNGYCIKQKHMTELFSVL